VQYTPGELKVVAYKNGKKWAENTVRTTGEPQKIQLSADRAAIQADGEGLSFITVRVTDKDGLMVPNAKSTLRFSIEGPGEIVATDNGDPSNLVSFASHDRDAFNGLCLVIVRAKPGQKGTIKLKAESGGLKAGTISLKSVSRK